MLFNTLRIQFSPQIYLLCLCLQIDEDKGNSIGYMLIRLLEKTTEFEIKKRHASTEIQMPQLYLFNATTIEKTLLEESLFWIGMAEHALSARLEKRIILTQYYKIIEEQVPVCH